MRTCRVEEKLVREISTMNGQLNSLSPNWVRDDAERHLIQEKRDVLRTELRQHHAKGHDGRRCPAFHTEKFTKMHGPGRWNLDLISVACVMTD